MCMHVRVEHYSTVRNGLLPFVTAQMDLEDTMLSESEDKHHVILLTGGIQKQNEHAQTQRTKRRLPQGVGRKERRGR